MKVILIKPAWRYPITRGESTYNRIWPPLCLMNCASLLEREGHSVTILDAHAKKVPPVRLRDYVNGFDKIFITSSALDRWQCPNSEIEPFLSSARSIRQRTEEVYVMGYHGTVRPVEILQLTGAKAVIRGEPEFTVAEICRREDLSNVEGVVFIHAGGVVSTKMRSPLELESLPIPAFHLIDIKKYFYEILGNNFALFEGSRGCPYSCSFCTKVMYGTRFRRKSAQRLIKEVDVAVNKYGVKTGYFIDLEFTTNRELVESICDLLIERKYNFEWCCQTRADGVTRPLLEKMKRSGCRLIHYGIETGSPRIMDLLNKQTSLEQLKRGVELTKWVGIKTFCLFMFGFPAETVKDMEETVSVAKKLNPTYASFHLATPYPGSRFFEQIQNKIDGLFPEAYTKEHSLVQLRKTVRKAFTQFYLRPSYVISKLKSQNLRGAYKQLYLFLKYLTK